jgi:hypothetical protein
MPIEMDYTDSSWSQVKQAQLSTEPSSKWSNRPSQLWRIVPKIYTMKFKEFRTPM